MRGGFGSFVVVFLGGRIRGSSTLLVRKEAQNIPYAAPLLLPLHPLTIKTNH